MYVFTVYWFSLASFSCSQFSNTLDLCISFTQSVFRGLKFIIYYNSFLLWWFYGGASTMPVPLLLHNVILFGNFFPLFSGNPDPNVLGKLNWYHSSNKKVFSILTFDFFYFVPFWETKSRHINFCWQMNFKNVSSLRQIIPFDCSSTKVHSRWHTIFMKHKRWRFMQKTHCLCW